MVVDKVLCALVPRELKLEIDEETMWLDLEDYSLRDKKLYYSVIPLINHPHSDIENGQKEVHYHADYRYNGYQPSLGERYKIDILYNRPIKDKYVLKHFDLIRYSEEFRDKTPVGLISKSKMKHKCIHKGKCPHRGFDLSGIEAVDGVITCPLHSLKFDAKTKKIIENGSGNNRK